MESKEQSIFPLLRFLLNKAEITVDLLSVKVEIMDDGGMGSHRFHTRHSDSMFACEVSSCTFLDSDGVEVSASLNVDQYGDLFEIDLFKGDFSSLKRWPLSSDFKRQEI